MAHPVTNSSIVHYCPAFRIAMRRSQAKAAGNRRFLPTRNAAGRTERRFSVSIDAPALYQIVIQLDAQPGRGRECHEPLTDGGLWRYQFTA